MPTDYNSSTVSSSKSYFDQEVSNIGASYTIDGEKASVFNLTLTASSSTIALQTPSDISKSYQVLVRIIQDSTGSRNVAFSGVTWDNNVTPTIAKTALAVTTLNFIFAGGSWRGFVPPNVNPNFNDVQINGALTTSAIRRAVRIITTSNFTISSQDDILIIQLATPSALTVTLPSSVVAGRIITIKDGAGVAAQNNITIKPASGTIDGVASLILNTNYANVTLCYNGAQWNRI
jgi:hypothetical protein